MQATHLSADIINNLSPARFGHLRIGCHSHDVLGVKSLRLLTCKITWYEIGDVAESRQRFADMNILKDDFRPSGRFYVTDKEIIVFGGRALVLSPGSVGMVPGFSVILDLNFETAKKNIEKHLDMEFDECDEMPLGKACTKVITEETTFGLIETDGMDGEEESADPKAVVYCAYPYQP